MSKKKRSTAKVNRPSVNKSRSKKATSKPSFLSMVKKFLLIQLASLIFETIFQDPVDMLFTRIKALLEVLF